MNRHPKISASQSFWQKPAQDQQNDCFAVSQGENQLFHNGLIRWQALTGAERFVGLAIVLAPVWWFISWSYMPLFMTIGLFAYHLVRHKQLGLTRPSLSVVALLLFTGYLIVLYRLRVPDVGPAGIIGLLQMWGTATALLWYVQSQKIRIRLTILAWAFSVVVLEAVLYWLFARFVLGEPFFIPSPNLIATFLGNTTFRSTQLGAVGNFLNPYNPSVRGPGGLVRYTFFFQHPTISSQVFAFAVLIALDLKNRLWSSTVIGASAFLILVCQSRNVWLVLPIVVLVHWLITTGKTRGLSALMAALAIVSFVTLSIPQVTEKLADRVTTTAEATGNLRKDSTDVRRDIYIKTWASILTEPPVIGHAVPGEEVVPGYEFGRVGTESFILGTVYRAGFLGTGMFLVFLISFLAWLWRTRDDRPLCCFLMLLLLALSSAVTEFSPLEAIILILCAITYVPKLAQPKPKYRPKYRYV